MESLFHQIPWIMDVMGWSGMVRFRRNYHYDIIMHMQCTLITLWVIIMCMHVCTITHSVGHPSRHAQTMDPGVGRHPRWDRDPRDLP